MARASAGHWPVLFVRLFLRLKVCSYFDYKLYEKNDQLIKLIFIMKFEIVSIVQRTGFELLIHSLKKTHFKYTKKSDSKL